jgi:hypothetical protein
MNGGVAHPASFSQGAMNSGGPFHNKPASSYTDQLNKPLSQPLAVHSQGIEQQQPLIQPTELASSSAVEAGTVMKTTEAKYSTTAAEVERGPAALQEKTDGVKQVKDSSVTDKKEEAQPKPHPQASVTVSENPLQERKEVAEIERRDKKGEHTGPADEEPTTKPHPPVTKTETSVEKEPTPSLPSKPDLNSEAGSLASVFPSSEQISDPFSLPSSSSLPKLPSLKKSLPPLLPPIGGATPTSATAGQSAKKAEQPETKLLENAALSSEREVKEGSDKGEGASGSSPAGAAATHRGSREGGGDSNAEVKVENKAADKEEGDGSSATVAATHVESPDVGKGSPKEHVHVDAGQQSTDRTGGGESNDGTTGSQEKKVKDGTSSRATKVEANGSDKHSGGQQTQVESQESRQSEASPAKKKERVNDKEEVKNRRQTDHLDGGGGGGGGREGERQGGRGEEEGKTAEGERSGKKATVSPPTSVVTPPPRQPRNLKVG